DARHRPGHRDRLGRVERMATPKARMMSSATIVDSRCDRLIVDRHERRSALIDVIRGARRTITLSLFRCNDRAILDALAAATARGVAVDVLVTSRSKGGRKRRE